MTAALGDRMRKLMRQHGINQSQLAARAGTTQPNISKYLVVKCSAYPIGRFIAFYV